MAESTRIRRRNLTPQCRPVEPVPLQLPRDRAGTGLSPEDHAARLAELRQWAEAILRREYGGYPLPECWSNHPHAIWELSTPAAEWHRTYNRERPDLNRALEFNDRWLPGVVRRIADITRRCNPECTTRRRRAAP